MARLVGERAAAGMPEAMTAPCYERVAELSLRLPEGRRETGI